MLAWAGLLRGVGWSWLGFEVGELGLVRWAVLLLLWCRRL